MFANRFPAACLGLAIVVLTALPAAAQEHPEHPNDRSTAVTTNTITLPQLAEAVTLFVTEDSDMRGGYFLVYDEVNEEPLALRLVQVHEERLSSLGNDTYFVCADFASTDGTVYDVDIFMEGKTQAELRPVQIAIHKMNGEERYTWYEEDGVWRMREI